MFLATRWRRTEAWWKVGLFFVEFINYLPTLCDYFLRIKIENVDYNTKFQLRNAERADSGVYKLKAENENGKDEATVNVNVIDKPAPPEGPLQVK